MTAQIAKKVGESVQEAPWVSEGLWHTRRRNAIMVGRRDVVAAQAVLVGRTNWRRRTKHVLTVALVSLVTAIATVLAAAVLAWRHMKTNELQADLTAEMVACGMDGEEVRRVLAAGCEGGSRGGKPSASGRRHSVRRWARAVRRHEARRTLVARRDALIRRTLSRAGVSRW